MNDRVIKFRAWDKAAKRMLQPLFPPHSALWPDNNGTLSYYNLQNGVGGSEVDLMQFTGLHDANDKEIYEGDILKWKCSKSGREKEDNYIVVIEWGRHGWDITIHADGEKWATGTSYWNASDREVIGNIFESPDLLNPKQ